MNSGYLKTYKNSKISKSKFFMITVLSLHCLRSENKEKFSLSFLISLSMKVFKNKIHGISTVNAQKQQNSVPFKMWKQVTQKSDKKIWCGTHTTFSYLTLQ